MFPFFAKKLDFRTQEKVNMEIKSEYTVWPGVFA